MKATENAPIKYREELKNKRKLLFKLFLNNPMHQPGCGNQSPGRPTRRLDPNRWSRHDPGESQFGAHSVAPALKS